MYEVPISADALRMRCRRMCEQKPSGKCHVDPAIVTQYKNGGEGREALEMALLESLAKYGVERASYKRIKVFMSKSLCVQKNLVSNCCISFI